MSIRILIADDQALVCVGLRTILEQGRWIRRGGRSRRRGLTNTEIGDQLHRAEGTVRTHVGRIFSKRSLRDRVQAVVLAYEAGVIRPGS